MVEHRMDHVADHVKDLVSDHVLGDSKIVHCFFDLIHSMVHSMFDHVKYPPSPGAPVGTLHGPTYG